MLNRDFVLFMGAGEAAEVARLVSDEGENLGYRVVNQIQNWMTRPAAGRITELAMGHPILWHVIVLQFAD